MATPDRVEGETQHRNSKKSDTKKNNIHQNHKKKTQNLPNQKTLKPQREKNESVFPPPAPQHATLPVRQRGGLAYLEGQDVPELDHPGPRRVQLQRQAQHLVRRLLGPTLRLLAWAGHVTPLPPRRGPSGKEKLEMP